jgi:hypothetical protein
MRIFDEGVPIVRSVLAGEPRIERMPNELNEHRTNKERTPNDLSERRTNTERT